MTNDDWARISADTEKAIEWMKKDIARDNVGKKKEKAKE